MYSFTSRKCGKPLYFYKAEHLYGLLFASSDKKGLPNERKKVTDMEEQIRFLNPIAIFMSLTLRTDPY